MPKFTFWPDGEKPERQVHCYRCGELAADFTPYEIDGGQVYLCDTCYSRERG